MKVATRGAPVAVEELLLMPCSTGRHVQPAAAHCQATVVADKSSACERRA